MIQLYLFIGICCAFVIADTELFVDRLGMNLLSVLTVSLIITWPIFWVWSLFTKRKITDIITGIVIFRRVTIIIGIKKFFKNLGNGISR